MIKEFFGLFLIVLVACLAMFSVAYFSLDMIAKVFQL